MAIAFNRPENHATLLDELAARCRGGLATAGGRARVEPSGLAALDTLLPGGGWPCGAVTELIPDTFGVGELELLLPALATLSRAGRALVFIAPPRLPCALGLAQRGIELAQLLLVTTRTDRETLWAAEQALRCPGVGAVLLWPAAPGERCVRRLQLAAETGGALGFLFRPATAAAVPSPAALRLCLHPRRAGTELCIIKARGGRPHALVLPAAAAAGF